MDNLEVIVLVAVAFFSGFIIVANIYERWSDQAVKGAVKSVERRFRKEGKTKWK